MPISAKLLRGATGTAGRVTRSQKSQAFKDGKTAFFDSKTLADYPIKYRPQPGHQGDTLHDSWVCGFKTAKAAGVPA